MFDPPHGYADLEGDAALGPGSAVLEVPEVGPVQAYRPRPASLPALVAAATAPSSQQLDLTLQFVQNHLAEGELERITVAMMAGTAPANSIERIARAVTTWGTARPYVAVVTLAVVTAHHWRTLRLRLVKDGISDPMSLPHMHLLLDATEAAVLESMPPDSMERTLFLDRLYSPLVDPEASNSGPPAGFSEEDMEASFDAFAAAAR